MRQVLEMRDEYFFAHCIVVEIWKDKYLNEYKKVR